MTRISPSFIGAGAGAANAATTAFNVAYPSSILADDLLICQIVVRDTTNTPNTPSGFSAIYSAESNGTTARQWLYAKIADGTETGNLSVQVATGAVLHMARIYQFRRTLKTAYNHAGGFGSATTNATISAQSVTTTKDNELAVSFIFIDNDDATASFTGESGGDWTEAVADFTTTTGADGAMQLQTAAIATAGTISGGSQTIAIADSWGVRAFALMGPDSNHAQAQADIKATGFMSAQALAYIKGTRFYLTSTGTNPSYTPAYDAEWDKTSEAARHRLETVKTNSPLTTYTASENVATTPYDVAIGQFISAPLNGAQTISGPIRGIIQVSESNAAADFQPQIIIRVIASDASTVRGTLIAADATALSNEFGTSVANRKFPKGYTGNGTASTPVNAQDGDRIVIEVGLRSLNSVTTNRTANFIFGDPTYVLPGVVDALENETDTASNIPWIEFSGYYNFKTIEDRASQDVQQILLLPNDAVLRVSQDVQQVLILPNDAATRVSQDVIQVLWAPDASAVTNYLEAQAQSDIKAQGFLWAQAQTDIKATGYLFAQAQATITKTGYLSAQAQADIKTTGYLFAQANADVKATGYLFGQCQADIKQRGFLFGQAQADIKQIGYLWGQAQADIKATGFLFGQSQADIKATGYLFAQSQADIKARGFLWGQCQADIKATGFLFAQAQARITGKPYLFGQAQADIKATGFLWAQAQADIKANNKLFAQAQGSITKASYESAQAQADIKATGYSFGQAQGDIKARGFLWAQCQADIKKTGFISAQAQADIKQVGYLFGQIQADVKATGYLWGQTQADIKARGFLFGQCQADIKHTYFISAQAQATIVSARFFSGQAQADIKARGYLFGQTNADIKARGYLFGQAQGTIRLIALHAQANASITVFVETPAAPTFRPEAKYLVRYNGYTLPGYSQGETINSVEGIGNHQAPYADMSLSEYLGLENKTFNVTMKVWESTFDTARTAVQRAATIARSNREGFAPLYVQYTDRYYEVMVNSIKTQKEVGTTHNIRDYAIEFEAKPWLKSDVTYNANGTSIIVIERTIDDGTWTPLNLILSGTDITVSGYTATQQTGFMSVSGTVADLHVDSENYTAAIGSSNVVDRMLWADFALYVGPGTTTIEVTGATDCQLSYSKRWLI